MGARAKIVSLQPNRYGIPGKEMTPHVRMALAALEQKIEALQTRVDELADLADRDPLIPVLNRRAFLEALQRTTAFVQRYGGDAAVIYIDLDAFKSINDTYGHQAGDQVLVGIAICISDSVRRAGDCPARYGGEEFAVLLPGCDATDAFKMAETIREKVMQWSEGPTVNTVSVGVASLTPTANMHWTLLLEAADKALYAAKANGRNQSVLASMPKLSLVA